MLKTLLGLGDDKRDKFNARVAALLIQELGIDANYETNPNFEGLGHVDLMSKCFYHRRTPEHCAMQIALSYLEKIVKGRPFSKNGEAVELEAKIRKSADFYTAQGALFPELKPVIVQVISKLRAEFG